MQRVLRIVLIAAVMLLLVLWFSTIFNTCKDKNSETGQTETMAGAQDTSDVFQDLDDEFFEDEQDLFSDETDQSGQENTRSQLTEEDGSAQDDIFTADDSEDYTDYTGAPTQNTVQNVNTAPDPNSNYLVVAGSFLVKDNADNMKRKIEAMGYTAEVRNFNYSQYHSVIAGRFRDKSSADNRANVLKAKGIDCYVHKRQD